MKPSQSFDERIAARLTQMSAAEQRVARYFQRNREQVLVGSAAELAAKAETSDATVLRSARSLGFANLDELRRSVASELRRGLTPADRVANTLDEVGDDPQAALTVTLGIHAKALDNLRRDISRAHFNSAVARIADASRTVIFGIGPSSAMADYCVIQLGRFGLDAVSLTRTGLLFADDLQKLRKGDLVVILAYSRVYAELEALLDRTDRRGLRTILLTDTLGGQLRDRVDLVLPVARGRIDMFSMHTATLALIEALLVGVAASRPRETIESLKALNDARQKLVGKPMTLPVL
jgi:DNA-binding MurR/RpiR family transcriptional regulator